MLEWRRLAANAEDFWSAAAQLLSLSGSREAPNLAFPASITVLTGFAWELFFKAYLAKAECRESMIKGYRHNLSELRQAAEANGWEFDRMVRTAKEAKTPITPQPSRDALFDSADRDFYGIWRMTDKPTDYVARYPNEKREVY